MRAHVLVLLLLLAACTAHSGSTSAPFSTSPPISNMPAPPGSVSSSTTPAPVPHVLLTKRGLSIDGKVVPLIGGEIHYFRTRDPNWDTQKTWALWEQALDQAKAAGLNLITTYVPWDFHEEQEGVLDFTGPRDLDHFLELCWQRGLSVYFRPGPYVQAEWPYGVHTYGGIPQWWKDKHPGSLALGPSGAPFNFDEYFSSPLGVVTGIFSPDLQQATTRWFSTLAPIMKKYIHDRPTIVMVQLDDEVNFFFHSRFSSDFGADSLAQYRGRLAANYGSIAALNSAYGTSYASFQDVAAPTQAPAAPANDLPVQDWFDAGKRGAADYLVSLRKIFEGLGIKEPDILFTTNDAPHCMPREDLQLWDGTTKNEAGLSTIDSYPKQFPWSTDRPQDYPFLTSFFTKRFLESNQDYLPGIRGAFASELEGGLFDLPLPVPDPVPVHTTDQVLLEFFGHGGVMGSIYMFRGGLNRDGQQYYEMAAVDQNGNPTARYPLVQRFATNLLGAHGAEFLASEEVEAPVAMVVGARFDIPASGVAGNPAWIQTQEAAGVYGWLEDAGLSPTVLDGERVKVGDLDRYKLVVYVNPDAAQDELARALDDYVRKGGSLLDLMHAGTHDASWRPTGVGPSLLAGGLFSEGTLQSVQEEVFGIFLPPSVNFALPNGFQGNMPTSSFLGKYDVTGTVQVFAHERTSSGADGKVAGWRSTRGAGQVFFLATSPGRPYRDFTYYDLGPSDFATPRALAAWIGSESGVGPTLQVQDSKARAFARKVDASQGGGLLVFCASRQGWSDTATIRLLDLAALGLDPATTYSAAEVLTNAALGTKTGADLVSGGIDVPLGAFDTAVIRLR